MKLYAAAIALFTAVGLTSAAQAETKLVFNTYLPPQSPVMAGSTQWIADVEAATDGEVDIEYTASSLAPPPRQLDAVRSGVADVAISVNSVLRGSVDLPILFELPRISEVESSEAHSVAMWRTYEKFFKNANEFKGVEVLGMYSMSPGYLYFAKGPIKSLDDMKGMRIRSNPDGAVWVDAVGGVMVSQQPPMQHELLSRGVIDGTAMPSWGMPMFDSVELAPHGFAPPGGFSRSTVVMFMNEGQWQSLSEEQREAIRSVSGEQFARNAGQIMDEMARKAEAEMLEKGGTFNFADEETTAELEKRMKVDEALQNWIELANSKGVDGQAAYEYYVSQTEELAK